MVLVSLNVYNSRNLPPGKFNEHNDKTYVEFIVINDFELLEKKHI